MNVRKRYLETLIMKDLSKKRMVFLGGPRQVGKTTLAKRLLKVFPYEKEKKGCYLNWDRDKEAILHEKWDEGHEIIVLDELHKYRRWKNWIKGLYDTKRDYHKFLVTGSARLDTYKRGGDSLLGRYRYWRLHPLDIDERPPKMSLKEAMDRLMRIGGFPEVFLDGDEQEAKRWRRERFERIIREDIQDLESVKLIQDLDLFTHELRRRAGQLVVFSNLAQDLQISPKTASSWANILHKMYVSFPLWPYAKNLPRAIQKRHKIYFFDNADLIVKDEGPLFENLVACHLLKKVHYLEDSQGSDLKLRYIRDKEGREVDFILLRDRHPFALIEAKLSSEKISPSLQYYSEKLNPTHSIQIVLRPKHEYKKGRCRVLTLPSALRVLFKNCY